MKLIDRELVILVIVVLAFIAVMLANPMPFPEAKTIPGMVSLR